MAEQQTYLIVGLGNPGPIYARTRHNVGFMCIERIAARNNLRFDTRRLRAEIARGVIDERNVMLAKPQTYMNDSGISVAEILHWYKIPTKNLLVIYDELDLPVGTIRLRERGSSAGHNGIKSIIAHIGSDFNRLRVGIGRPSTSGPTRDYVLNNFSRQDAPVISEAIDLTAEAAEVWLREGIIAAMNRYNPMKPGGTSQELCKSKGEPWFALIFWEHTIWGQLHYDTYQFHHRRATDVYLAGNLSA